MIGLLQRWRERWWQLSRIRAESDQDKSEHAALVGMDEVSGLSECDLSQRDSPMPAGNEQAWDPEYVNSGI
jgi:hypothetical protein